MNQIKVVKITEVKAHPDSSKLKICMVNDDSQVTQVVCGASNVRLNMLTLLAPVGSTLPNGTAITKAQLRGVDSYGMLCSAKDLSVSQEGGIIDLPESIKLSTELNKIPKDLLSSTPWHIYQEVDELWENPTTHEIKVLRTKNAAGQLKNFKLISKTYFYENKYHYRHFN